MMDSASLPGRTYNRRQSRRKPKSRSALFEPLEARALLAAAVINPIPDINVVTGAGPTTVSTIDTFRDSAINGTVVQFLFANVNPEVTAVNIEMFDLVTPITVANFLSYVTAGRYDNTIIHRSMPNFVVQGGGFTSSLSSVSTFPPIQNEAAISNTRGTIAMAKTPGNPNSATSQWFFNVNNNGGTPPNGLDYQNGGFTVFGRVLGNGLTTIDKINDLPTFNAGGSFTDLPLSNYVVGSPLQPENLVTVTDVSVRKPVIVSNAVSNKPELVTVTIDDNGNLKLEIAEGMTGTASITVTGTSANGTFATDTFNVTVEAGQSPVAGSGAFVAELNRAINITSTVFDLTSDPDGTIDRSSFQAVKLPSNGQLFFNASTQQIVYQPNPGFVGEDTFTYTVRDNHGFISNVGTMTATVESVTTLSSGPGGINQLIYIDADGTRVDINLSGSGKVKLNFAGSPSTLRVTGNVGYMLGTNLSIANMQVSDTNTGSLLLISTRGGTDQTTALNGITVSSHMTGIWAPSVKLGSGGLTTTPGTELGYVRLNDVGSSASITLAGNLGDSVVILRDVATGVNANFAASVAYLRARSWATGQINTTHVDTFLITGSTASGVRLTTTLANRGVEWVSIMGGITGSGGFNIASPIAQVLVGANIGSGASLNATSAIEKFTVVGNMAGNLQVAQSVVTFKVAGDLAGANILIGTIGSLLVGGKIQNSFITGTSLINNIIAQSMVGSMIRVAPADTTPPAPGGDQLPDSPEDFNTTGPGTLGFLFLTGGASTPSGTATFANSRVSAKSVNDLILGPVNTNNAGTGFGVAAMNYAGRVKLKPLSGSGEVVLSDISSQADIDAQLLDQGFAKGNLILRFID